MVLYYITDRCAFRGDERALRHRLLDKIAEAAAFGVNYIQLREKDMSAREFESLARQAMKILGERTAAWEPKTALLINSRTDIALAVGAAGIHLRGDDVSPEDFRAAWKSAEPAPLIGVSCHTKEEVSVAAANGVSFAVFGPVFEKKGAQASAATGVRALSEACRPNINIPVLALGGVTLQNAATCLQAGAAGIAAIRLFQENDIATIVRALRG